MKETFANRLEKAMSLRNIKASELSEKANVPKSAISQYLSGLYEAKQKSIFKIANVLNVSEAWLMGLDVPMEVSDGSSDIDNSINYKEYNGINTEGLTDEEIEQVKQFVEFMKNKKRNEKK